ncbi:Rossmann fold nucleotide-binding protein Smf [Minicystis rosea]|nr:Rossmann fold nucleotide-binding protein Smf [Minicystis rosea]
MSPSISIPPTDPSYPAALGALGRAERPPPTIFVRGALPASTGVAVVGTREPSAEAVAFTRALAGELAREGIAVWSGGAFGIDAAAHEGALEAGGITVVVAGGGLDRPYPPKHRELFERVLARGGALVARVPDGTPPMPAHFLARNEVLAALTSATVVVQAGLASGARSTAAAARRLGRTLCVVPHPPWDGRGHGCAVELTRGAIPVLGSADVLAALGRPPPPPAPRRPGRRKRASGGDGPTQRALPLPALPDLPLDPAEEAILAVLGEVPTHQDEVCEGTSLPGSAVLGALLTLTLRAVVVEGPAGFFRRAPRFA